jgi:hypothetical protein
MIGIFFLHSEIWWQTLASKHGPNHGIYTKPATTLETQAIGQTNSN